MRFLCVSDQIDPLVYSNSVKERYGDVDAIFCAGDLPMDYVDYIVTSLNKPTFFVFGNHNLKDFNYYEKKCTDYSAQGMSESISHSHGGDYVSKKMLRHRHLHVPGKNGKPTPLLVTGVSGSLKYNNGQAQYTDFQMKLRLMSLIPSLLFNKLVYGRYCDIFLTHASPRHIHDKEDPCHKGFECFNWFIKKFSPTLMIHGHIHLYDMQAKRTTVIGNTTIVNVFSHVIIEMNENEKGEKSEQSIRIRTDQ